MDWILGHLPVVIALATFIAGWVAQQRKKFAEADLRSDRGAQRAAQTQPPPLKPAAPDTEQIRSIQDEIRRKIQERATGREAGKTSSPFRPAIPPPRSAEKPRPVFFPPSQLPSPPRKEVQPRKSVVRIPSSNERETEQVRRSAERRREARKIDQAAVQVANAAQAGGTDGSNFWKSELQNPAYLRKALVLREILGPPVSMQR